MKKLILGIAALVTLTSSAWAAPVCTAQTLDQYIALGSGGCIMNDLLFNNFNYTYTMGVDVFYSSGLAGTGTVQAASVVQVNVDTANTALNFQASWIVNHYQTSSLTLTFNVSSPSSVVNTLTNTFTATQSGTENGGPTSSKSANCTGGTCGSPTDFTNATSPITGSHGPLLITNTFNMNANGSTSGSTNNVHLSIFSDQFTSTQDTPEPATYGMLGLGLAGLGLFRFRRK